MKQNPKSHWRSPPVDQISFSVTRSCVNMQRIGRIRSCQVLVIPFLWKKKQCGFRSGEISSGKKCFRRFSETFFVSRTKRGYIREYIRRLVRVVRVVNILDDPYESYGSTGTRGRGTLRYCSRLVNTLDDSYGLYGS